MKVLLFACAMLLWVAQPAVTLAVTPPQSANASLDEMVGSLLVLGFTGTTPEDPGVETARLQAEKGYLSGLIFYGYNIVSPQQTRDLITHIRSWKTPRPLILALDQEGGRVSRLASAKGFANYPGAFEAAQAGDTTAYDAMADAVASMGFDLNLAPVVDLAIQEDGPAIAALGRAFGRDTAAVVTWARYFVETHRRAGVRTALKHFPGHGSATADSHRGLTDVTYTWHADEMAPFAQMIRSGHADAVMSAHVSHRLFDAEHPLSLSPSFLRATLREGLGYDGVLISDALDMGALTRFYSTEEIAVRSLLAGHDLLVFSHNPAASAMDGRAHSGNDDAAERLHQRIVFAFAEALANGRISYDMLRTAAHRAEAFGRANPRVFE